MLFSSEYFYAIPGGSPGDSPGVSPGDPPGDSPGDLPGGIMETTYFLNSVFAGTTACVYELEM